MRYLPMKHLSRVFCNNNTSSIGIGTMIVFIAMILVAGIAASVLIQASAQLESQGLKTGQDTKTEVSSDIDVLRIIGNYNTRLIDGTSYSRFHNMSIIVTPRGGSYISLSEVIIEISNGSKMVVLSWDSNKYAAQSSGNGIFSTPEVFNLSASSFGIIVIEDADDSCGSTNPVINHGDKAVLTVNLSACFNGLKGRDNIEGMVIGEYGGSPGIFLFRVPKTSSAAVVKFL